MIEYDSNTEEKKNKEKNNKEKKNKEKNNKEQSEDSYEEEYYDDASQNYEDTSSGNEGSHKKRDSTIGIYQMPELIFTTRRKHIRKLYKKLIVRLHPDKVDYEKRELFKEYYDQCKVAVELRCLYKLWMLSQKIGIKVKVNRDIATAFNKEINILKDYVENLKNSEIYRWIHNGHNEEEVIAYIKYNMRMR